MREPSTPCWPSWTASGSTRESSSVTWRRVVTSRGSPRPPRSTWLAGHSRQCGSPPSRGADAHERTGHRGAVGAARVVSLTTRRASPRPDPVVPPDLRARRSAGVPRIATPVRRRAVAGYRGHVALAGRRVRAASSAGIRTSSGRRGWRTRSTSIPAPSDCPSTGGTIAARSTTRNTRSCRALRRVSPLRGAGLTNGRPV